MTPPYVQRRENLARAMGGNGALTAIDESVASPIHRSAQGDGNLPIMKAEVPGVPHAVGSSAAPTPPGSDPTPVREESGSPSGRLGPSLLDPQREEGSPPTRDREQRMLKRSPRTLQHGQVAVLFALAAVAIIAIVGLAIDAGQAFTDRSALQSGSDAAVVSGTQLIQANFVAEDQATSQGQAPKLYTDKDIAQAIESTLNASHATTSRVTSYTAYYTNNQGQPLNPPIPVGSLGPVPPPADAQGIAITAIDNQPTFLLGVLGIGQSHPMATATAVTGPITGCVTDSNCIPFAVGLLPDCQTGTTSQWSVGDTATYYSNQWLTDYCDKGTSADKANDFKGHFNSANPQPGSVVICTSGADMCDTPTCAGAYDCPNDVTSQGGAKFSSTTQQFLNNAWLTSKVIVVAEVTCDDCTGYSHLDVTGFIALKMTDPCSPSDQAGSTGCQGTVIASAESVAGLNVGKFTVGSGALALQLLT